MLNFIVVDDIEFFRKQVSNTILKFSFNIEEEVYKYVFDEYNKDFKKISNSKLENKIYVLDIETKNSNGIEEARKIRKFDKECKIVFLTLYENTYGGNLLRSSLDFYFISKTENIGLNNALLNCFMNIYNSIKSNEKLSLIQNNFLYNIKYDDIYYIKSEFGESIIQTKNKRIMIKKSLSSLLIKLPDFFFQCHRSCIVNLKNIVFIGKKIIFSNGKEINKISKYRKKLLVEAFKKEQNMH